MGTVSECAVDGEKSLDCGSKEGKQSCCEGLVCHDVQYWRCVTPEENVCAGPVPLHKSVVLNGMTLQQNAVMVSFVLVNIARRLILEFVQWMVKNRSNVDRKRVKMFVAKD